jgi:uncharacterized protein YkwD
MQRTNSMGRKNMTRFLLISVFALFGLAACESTAMRMGPEGRPVPAVYRISSSDAPRVQTRMRDAVNTLRAQNGLGPLVLNAQLASAAATHARDMSVQGRPWHFGSDGSSPIDRVTRASYPGTMMGELISETYETELETLTAWIEMRETRNILLEPRAIDMGIAWHQDANGKLWWVMVTGEPAQGTVLAAD